LKIPARNCKPRTRGCPDAYGGRRVRHLGVGRLGQPSTPPGTPGGHPSSRVRNPLSSASEGSGRGGLTHSNLPPEKPGRFTRSKTASAVWRTHSRRGLRMFASSTSASSSICRKRTARPCWSCALEKVGVPVGAGRELILSIQQGLPACFTAGWGAAADVLLSPDQGTAKVAA
jgi:hypothetical protein